MVITKSYGTDRLPPVRCDEVARYSGTPREQLCLDRLAPRLDGEICARVCYRIYDISVSDEQVNINGVGNIRSHSLALCLSGCSRVAIFAATLGYGVDRLIRASMLTSPSEGCILGALGSERTEALCDLFASELDGEMAKEGFSTRPRFSPGYGDLPLEFQREIFRALGVTRCIGVSLGEGCIMTPEKTVTAIIGIKQVEK